MKITIEQFTACVKSLIDDDEFNTLSYLEDYDNFESCNEIYDYLYQWSKNIYECEITYCTTVMEFLSEHDRSLEECMGLAYDMGYTADTLNNELLATILKQHLMREFIYKLEKQIEDTIDDFIEEDENADGYNYSLDNGENWTFLKYK